MQRPRLAEPARRRLFVVDDDQPRVFGAMRVEDRAGRVGGAIVDDDRSRAPASVCARNARTVRSIVRSSSRAGTITETSGSRAAGTAARAQTRHEREIEDRPAEGHEPGGEDQERDGRVA